MNNQVNKYNNIYQFELIDYQSRKFSLNLFKNKVMLIVNVASKCGLSETTYERMKKILDIYQNQIILILCPCKQFLNQEFDDIEDIFTFVKQKLGDHCNESNKPYCTTTNHDFIDKNTNVILTSAMNVKGKHIDPLFNYLISEQGGWFTNSIKWNFSSFLIDKKGNVIKRYSPLDFPRCDDPYIKKAVYEDN